MNALRTLRNHWKKSVFFTGVTLYGVNYGRRKYHEAEVLEAYCLEAKKYGQASVKYVGDKPRQVTVFLNPAAHKGKAKSLFEKNVAPLLHLAGLEVTLVLTEYEGQAKKYMDVMDHTDAIVVAGGNGTLSEVVTGMLRRSDEEQFSKIPLGVIPLGYTNTMAKSLCPSVLSHSVLMNEMAMSIIRGNMKTADVIKIQTEDEKSVYAVHGVDWGSYADTDIRKKKYWYFGALRDYLSLVVSSVRYWPSSSEAYMSYIDPCSGCSQCYVPPPAVQWKWWHLFLSPKRPDDDLALKALQKAIMSASQTKDYSKVINEGCGIVHEEEIDSTHVALRIKDSKKKEQDQEEIHSMTVNVIPGPMTRSEYIRVGQQRNKMLKHEGEGDSNKDLRANHRSLKAREITLKPKTVQNEDGSNRRAGDQWILIDREQFELKSVTCRLIPNKLHFFFSESFTVPVDGTTGRLMS